MDRSGPPAPHGARPRRHAPALGAILLALAVALWPGRVALAQDVTEPALKAAFIYIFARFRTWRPYLPATVSFVICVLGDTAVGDSLERAVA
jgi:hypothetical protein